MANISYVKGVRTRFRNILEKEIPLLTDIIHAELPQTVSDLDQQITRCDMCLEKLSSYKEKVQTQSEKLSALLTESDNDFLTTILDEDTYICESAVECVVKIRRHKEKLTSLKVETEELPVKQERLENVAVTELVQLQREMKELLSFHMKDKSEAETKPKSTQLGQTCHVKLPKLELLSFNGDKTKWPEFWNSFECSVHQNTSLSNVEKFNYLKGKMYGVARETIAGLALTNENYGVAVGILKERFGNVQEVIKIHYDRLVNLQPATSKVSSLRQLLDTVNKHLRSLDVLGQNINQDVFVSMLWSKLPEDVLLQLQLKFGVNNKWSITKLSDMLHEYVMARERFEKKGDSEKEVYYYKKKEIRPQSVGASGYTKASNNVAHTSVHALVAKPNQSKQITRSQESYRNKCRYCQKTHWSDECPSFRTIRERKEKLKNSCFRCLKEGHKGVDCKSNKSCVYCSEHNSHHRSLCPKKFTLNSTIAQLAGECNGENKEVDHELSCDENALLSTKEIVLMQTALTKVTNTESDCSAEVRLLFDSGSQRTYVTEELCNQLGLKVHGGDTLNLVTFGSTKPQKVKTKRTEFNLKLKDGSSLEITANVVPVISGDLYRKPVNSLKKPALQQILQSVDLADNFPTSSERTSIEILIGNDFYLDLILGQKIELQPGLFLLSSKLGWILSGRTCEYDQRDCDVNMLVLTPGSLALTTNSIQRVDPVIKTKPDIEDFWNVESIGVIDNDVTINDEIASASFKETLFFENGRYQVQWPWKDDSQELPENRELAMGRLKSLMGRLKTKPELLEKYNDVIEDQLCKGIVEKVERYQKDGKVHYIPHHAVITPQKTTTKVRIVYDASAKTKSENKSLNECLFRGPVLLHDLCGMLIRFRMHPVAIMADIEKAFLQIGLQNDQRDVTRFLWVKDSTILSASSDNIQEYRFTRIPFGVISSPFLLGATVNFHLDSYNNSVANQIKNDIYVDNLITGCDSVADACKLYAGAKSMFNEASMNLREWVSNDQNVIKTFQENDRVDSESVNVLGHTWNVQNDTFGLKHVQLGPSEMPVTKRWVLKTVASMFDPLGVFAPVSLRGKMFIQYLWSKHVDWDEEIPKDQREKWNQIIQDLKSVHNYAIPRCIALQSVSPKEYTIACFCDASQSAYCTVIYIHESTGDQSKANMCFTKTRLSPLKKITIPRLEFMAVMIGLRCVQFVIQQIRLPIVRTFLWTDSQCALHWISSTKPQDTFVKNRVTEIKKTSKNVTLAYVPTSQNPADVATRGMTAADLMKCDLWWKGPDWLQKDRSSWPTFETRNDPSDKGDPQTLHEKESSTKINESQVHVACEPEVQTAPPCTIEIERFSCFKRLLRVTALVLRFIKNLKGNNIKGQVTNEEIKKAEEMWILSEQRRSYKDVFRAISEMKENNLQKQLGLYVDDLGMLRCRGRLQNSSLTESARLPILLPQKSRLVQLYIEHIHKKFMHSGVSQTLSSLRLKFWIPHGRSTVRKVLHTCQVCKRVEGGPYKMPPMAPLPASRVSESTPFSHTGLDYMGPFYIKEDGETKKVWGCLFTCMVTRAVHLELVSNMTTNAFLNCLRRFIASRGTPKQIMSDNAKHFKLAHETTEILWENVVKRDDVQSYCSNEGIQWRFIVELAPWMGGFYERMVGLIKRSLRKAIGKKMLNFDQLNTVLKESESVINSRPLVYVGDDVNSTIVITPGHFLCLNPYTGIPESEIVEKDPDYQPKDSSAEKILQIWKKGQKLLDSFWYIWRHEYLTSLRERKQTKLKRGKIQSNNHCKIGDIVLLKDNIPRGNWKLARVVEIVTSADGLVRSAKVQTQSGKMLGRPLCLLYPIETSDVILNEHRTSDKELTSSNTRPTRKASIKAREQLKKCV